MSADPIIQLHQATKTYRMGEVNVQALKEISLEFQPGEFVVILGPSGCGKTTLMNLIGGLDSPTTGSVTVAGLNISRLTEAQLTRFRRSTVGFVFQFFNLVNTLTARENVQLAADLAEKPLNVTSVLRSVGLLERADHFPSELSGGEQQRVAIARALVKQAPVLLCDEPTGELDFETGRTVLELLHATTHGGAQTVLVVTHNASIADVADRVLKMRSGQVIADNRNSAPIDPRELSW